MSENHIVLDENNTPIWAIIYTLFRMGKHSIIQELLK
jgi:hypothetical protein